MSEAPAATRPPTFGDALRAWFGRQPRWVAVFFVFCLYMTFVFFPFDFLWKPLRDGGVSGAQEVWLGIVLTGWAAKATEPLHALIYGALAWGLWKERPWVWPAAALYVFQVAVSMLVWNLRDPRGGAFLGLVVFVAFAAFALLLRRRGQSLRASPTSAT